MVNPIVKGPSTFDWGKILSVMWDACLLSGKVTLSPGLQSGGLLPEIPRYCESEWRDIMMMCWDFNPNSRPAFNVLATLLQDIIDRNP